MNTTRQMLFCFVTLLGTNATSSAQQEPAFWIDQSISYMRIAEKLQLSAEQGQPEVQTQLAQMYERGLGLPQNIYKAIELYRKAALLGFEPAQMRLESLGVDVLPVSQKEFSDTEEIIENEATGLTQITIKIGDFVSSRSTFDWSPSRLIIVSKTKRKRATRRRPLMATQHQSNRGVLSFAQKSRAGLRLTGTN